MNKETFLNQFSGELKTFLSTPCGQNLLITLSSMKPVYESPSSEHLYADNRGAIRGYEICVRNLVGLCAPTVKNEEIEANYGVPDKQQPNEK